MHAVVHKRAWQPPPVEHKLPTGEPYMIREDIKKCGYRVVLIVAGD